MAELNARIIPKASGTAGEVPLASDLETAELAVNTADGTLFTKDVGGTVVTISGDTINKATFQSEVAASTDFADFQSRIAAL